MNACYFLRGCIIPQEYTNPLGIKNFQREDPFNGVFYTVATSESFYEQAKEDAESYAKIQAERQKRQPLVVAFVVQENTFSVLAGRINNPLFVFGKRREKPIITFAELQRFNLKQVTLNSEKITSDEMQLLRIKLGTVDSEGKFRYQDFAVPAITIEGNQKALRERA